MDVALLGCGNQGLRHFRNLLRLQHEGQIGLVHVFDPDVSIIKNMLNVVKILEEEHGYDVYWDFKIDLNDKLWKEDTTEVEALVIASPTFSHFQSLLDGVRYNSGDIKGVLVEKPIGIDFVQATAMKEFADKRGFLLMPGHTERFNPAIIELYQRVQLDKPKNTRLAIATTRVGFCPLKKRHEYGGLGRNLLVHDIDLANWLVGGVPHSVYVGRFAGDEHIDLRVGFQAIYVWNETTSLNAHVCYRENKFAKAYAIEVWFDEHRYRVEVGDQIILKFDKDNNPTVIDPRRVGMSKKEEPIYLELSNFLQSVKYRGTTPFITAQDGINAIQWCHDKVQDSLRMGKNKFYEKLEGSKHFWLEEPE